MRKTKLRRAAGAVVISAILASTTVASAGLDFTNTIPDGHWSGNMSLYVGFEYLPGGSDAGANGSGTFVGPVTMDIAGEAVNGEAVILATADVSVLGQSGSGSQTMAGNITGTSSTPTLVLGQDLPMAIDHANCGLAWGVWGEDIWRRNLEGSGVTVPYANGSWVVRRTIGDATDDIELANPDDLEAATITEELGRLFDAAQIQSNLTIVEGQSVGLTSIRQIIRDANQLQNQLQNLSPCEGRTLGAGQQGEFRKVFSGMLDTLIADLLTKASTSPSWAELQGLVSIMANQGLLNGNSASATALRPHIEDAIAELREANPADKSLMTAKGAYALLRTANAVDVHMLYDDTRSVAEMLAWCFSGGGCV